MGKNNIILEQKIQVEQKVDKDKRHDISMTEEVDFIEKKAEEENTKSDTVLLDNSNENRSRTESISSASSGSTRNGSSIGSSVHSYLNEYVNSIWYKYDNNNSGFIGVDNTKQMMIEVTNNKIEINLQDVKKFINRFDTTSGLSGELPTITIQELIQAIENGLSNNNNNNNKKNRQKGKSNRFENMLATFFSSIEEKLESLHQKKVDGIRRFLDYIWKKYDTDESGFIEADETKQMLEDVTGQNETISKQDVATFLKSVTSSESITKSE